MAKKRSKVPQKPGSCVKVRMGGSGLRWLCRQSDGGVRISAGNGKKTPKKKSTKKRSKR